ncbi:hypothetical protein LL033_11975 [Clostridium estertheticum]|uniref:hypothetical protein n=1 Tax=Clostridium estertheticum TaxID=238834 RepID=UPI001C0BE0E3|nr:hypothetical protein [Clostridium estertheticum]MBU3215869.1 hypothetical protein [Clostridium estertheticum]WAG57825.1 hypothetical protein LL033_11975 [Clostridium estertheticum]
MINIERELNSKRFIEDIINEFRNEFGIYFEVQGNKIDLEYVKVEQNGFIANSEYIVVNIGYINKTYSNRKPKQLYINIDEIVLYKKITNMTYTKIILKSIIEKLIFNNGDN